MTSQLCDEDREAVGKANVRHRCIRGVWTRVKHDQNCVVVDEAFDVCSTIYFALVRGCGYRLPIEMIVSKLDVVFHSHYFYEHAWRRSRRCAASVVQYNELKRRRTILVNHLGQLRRQIHVIGSIHCFNACRTSACVLERITKHQPSSPLVDSPCPFPAPSATRG
jgi:hypothetical protein